jgi:hypothetical protein
MHDIYPYPAYTGIHVLWNIGVVYDLYMSLYAFHLGQIISTVLGVNMVTLPEPQSGAKRPKLTTPQNDALAIVLSTKP